MTSELETIRNDNYKLKERLELYEKERDSGKDKVRELEARVKIQGSNTGLEFELQSLKRYS